MSEKALEQRYNPFHSDYDHRPDGAETRQYRKTERDAAFHAFFNSNDYRLPRIAMRPECSASILSSATMGSRPRSILFIFSHPGASLHQIVILFAPKDDAVGPISTRVAFRCSHTASSRHSQREVPSRKEEYDRYANKRNGPVVMRDDIDCTAIMNAHAISS